MNDYPIQSETNSTSSDEGITESGSGCASPVEEYKGAPSVTENEIIISEEREFENTYLAPKKIIVRRYKLKKY